MKLSFYAFAIFLFIPISSQAQEKKNFFSIELLGGKSTAGIPDELENRGNFLVSNLSAQIVSQEENTTSSSGIGLIYERAISRQRRIGIRYGIERLGLGSLKSNSIIPINSVNFLFNEEIEVWARVHSLSTHMRFIPDDGRGLSPYFSLGLNYLKGRTDVDISAIPVISGSGPSAFSSIEYESENKIFPDTTLGLDYYFKFVSIGIGLNYMFTGKVSNFENSNGQDLFINNKEFEADFSGLFYFFSLKINF